MILVYFGKEVSTMIRENDQSDLALEFSLSVGHPNRLPSEIGADACF